MLRILFGALMAVLFVFSLRSVLRGTLELRDAFIWILLSVGGLALALFPGLMHLAQLLGFRVESNALLSLGIVALLYLNFLQANLIARLRRDQRSLAQSIAIGSKK